MKNDAPSFCDRAAELMRERGKQYDKPEGERSMARTVAAFNAVTGRDLSEPEGWLLMLLLKQVRQWQQPGKYHADSAEDGVAYSALLAESLARMPEKQDAGQSMLDQARAAFRVSPLIEGVHLTDDLRPVCPIPKLPLLPIVVGGRYRRRDGLVSTIVLNDGMSAPFEADSGFWYLPDGKLCGSCGPDLYDLVERIA